MPEECERCRFYDGYQCKLTDHWIVRIYPKKRPAWCPLEAADGLISRGAALADLNEWRSGFRGLAKMTAAEAVQIIERQQEVDT